MACSVQRLSRPCALLIAAFSLVACGGSDLGRPKPQVTDAGAFDQCAADDALTFQNIMDFEPTSGGNPNLKQSATCDATVDTAKSPCTYFNFDSALTPRSCAATLTSTTSCLQVDGTPVSSSFCQTPDMLAAGPNLVLSAIPPDARNPSGGRCGVSSNAYHFAATNIATCYDAFNHKQGWGATIQLTINPSASNSGQSTEAFDASAWDGVSFWERRGDGPSGAAILFSIQDPYSANASTVKNFDRPPDCAPGVTSKDCFVQCSSLDGIPDAQKCDAFGLGVGLTSDWQFVKVPFAEAQQKGFGVPSQLGHLDTSALVGFQFALSAGSWDMWIDDIAFYREASTP